MNILVTGANGQLGTELRNVSAGLKDFRFVFTDVNELPDVETTLLDITNPDAVRVVVRSEKPDVIINCAAYTNVEKAEEDIPFAELLNSGAPANLAAAAAESGATLIHVSTDYVFSGEGCTPVRESDSPAPASVYGSTKLSGEKAVERSGCNYIILRTAWLYSPYGKNFVKTMKEKTSPEGSLKVVYDQVGSPTYARDLAEAIMHIITSGQTSKKGIYHYSNEGAISWFDFACEIRDLTGGKASIKPCLTSEFPTKARRPHYSVLDKALFRETFGIEVPYWKDSLKKCISRL